MCNLIETCRSKVWSGAGRRLGCGLNGSPLWWRPAREATGGRDASPNVILTNRSEGLR